MKVRLIKGYPYQDDYIIEFEEAVNDFIKNKNIVDIKYSETQEAISALILYEEKSKTLNE